MGTEFASTVSTRGIYENDPIKGYVSAYDMNFPPWASTAEGWWTYFAERQYLSGGFVWTGFDYRGEPTPYGWPCISSHFGIMDMCGFPKDLFYYYKSWWGPENESVLHLLPHWNWAGKEGQEIDVWCFTNCHTVELFVNGVSQGWQKVEKNGHAEWKVRYRPGVIEVRGLHDRRAGTLIARRETAGAPAALAASNSTGTPDAMPAADSGTVRPDPGSPEDASAERTTWRAWADSAARSAGAAGAPVRAGSGGSSVQCATLIGPHKPSNWASPTPITPSSAWLALKRVCAGAMPSPRPSHCMSAWRAAGFQAMPTKVLELPVSKCPATPCICNCGVATTIMSLSTGSA